MLKPQQETLSGPAESLIATWLNFGRDLNPSQSIPIKNILKEWKSITLFPGGKDGAVRAVNELILADLVSISGIMDANLNFTLNVKLHEKHLDKLRKKAVIYQYTKRLREQAQPQGGLVDIEAEGGDKPKAKRARDEAEQPVTQQKRVDNTRATLHQLITALEEARESAHISEKILREEIDKQCRQFNKANIDIYCQMAKLYTLNNHLHLPETERNRFLNILSELLMHKMTPKEKSTVQEALGDLVITIFAETKEQELSTKLSLATRAIAHYHEALKFRTDDTTTLHASIIMISENLLKIIPWPSTGLERHFNQATIKALIKAYFAAINFIFDHNKERLSEQDIADIKQILWRIIQMSAPHFTTPVTPYFSLKECQKIFSTLNPGIAQEILNIKLYNHDEGFMAQPHLTLQEGVGLFSHDDKTAKIKAFVPNNVDPLKVAPAHILERDSRRIDFENAARGMATIEYTTDNAKDEAEKLIREFYGDAYLDFLYRRAQLADLLGFPIYVDDLMSTWETLIDGPTLTAVINNVAAAISATFCDEHHTAGILRPPGHHGSPISGPQGFCFLASAGLATLALLKKINGKADQEVCYLDSDIHAGNGTHDLFELAAKKMNCSHLTFNDFIGKSAWRPDHDPVLPGRTCASTSEIINGLRMNQTEIASGTSYDKDKKNKPSYKNILLSHLDAQYPNNGEGKTITVFISGGFDTHQNDAGVFPADRLNIKSENFGSMIQDIYQLFQKKKYSSIKIKFFTEGGYRKFGPVDHHLEESMRAVFRGLSQIKNAHSLAPTLPVQCIAKRNP